METRSGAVVLRETLSGGRYPSENQVMRGEVAAGRRRACGFG